MAAILVLIMVSRVGRVRPSSPNASRCLGVSVQRLITVFERCRVEYAVRHDGASIAWQYMKDSRSFQASNPVALAGSLWRNRYLIWQMSRREVLGRYRGSILGLTWSFFYPVLMLAVYTFVFSVVFRMRWGGLGAAEGKAQFAIILFVGMIVHALLAEVLNRAPTLILSNPSYVKKVVFPLEILPVVAMGSALFHALVSLLVLVMAMLLTGAGISSTALLLPLILLPLVILVLGGAWFLSSLGVYLRDVGQTIGVITTVMLFLAPVFYPIDALPEQYRPWLYLNPLTFVIEQARAVLVWRHAPNYPGLVLYWLVAVAVAWGGYLWFQKTRRGFADVL